MEQEGKDSRPSRAPAEANLFLQWGTRKRLRCVKALDDGSPSPACSEGLRRAAAQVNWCILGGDITPSHSPRRPNTHCHRKSDSESMSLSPEKDWYYPTRGSPFPLEGNGIGVGSGLNERGAILLPRFFIALSNKEKEEDFMAMKGCKLPQRPKKRSKSMQRFLLCVSPGSWLSDLSHERYEVREKKGSRKRTRGLKALSMESDSE